MDTYVSDRNNKRARQATDVEYPGPVGRLQAPYGAFYDHPNRQFPRRHAAGWQLPDPAFLAALPRDPEAFVLVHEAAGQRRELLINPRNGQYAGQRYTRTVNGGPGLRATSSAPHCAPCAAC